MIAGEAGAWSNSANEGGSGWASVILYIALVVLDFHRESQGTGKVAEEAPDSFSKVSETESLVVWSLVASQSLRRLPLRA